MTHHFLGVHPIAPNRADRADRAVVNVTEGCNVEPFSCGIAAFSAPQSRVERTGKGDYHSLYGVLSNGETRGEFECTSTIPVVV